MISLPERIKAFAELGAALRLLTDFQVDKNLFDGKLSSLNELIADVHQYNAWFTPKSVKKIIASIAYMLTTEKLEKWTGKYGQQLVNKNKPADVAVIMAGNVPLVGFHDFLSVLITGNNLIVKMSADDNKLLPALSELLFAIEPAFREKVSFRSGTMSGFDAVIATGSNNTSRYFEYYFGKYPHIIRKNRNSVAVIKGNESEEELTLLTDDIFDYFGLGCRNVSKIMVPEKYDFNPLLDCLGRRNDIIENNKYFNNYEYNKAIYLVNNTVHYDTGNLLLVEHKALSSPVSVIHYETYHDLNQVKNRLLEQDQEIQCVVSQDDLLDGSVPFGRAQQPELWDYADGVDTVEFNLNI